MRREYRVPYSRSTVEFDLLPGMRGTVVEPRPAKPLTDVEGAIAEALTHPIGLPPLREMVRPGDRACIVFTDVTRASPDHLLVPALLREIEAAGVRDEDVTLLVALACTDPLPARRRSPSWVRRQLVATESLTTSRRILLRWLTWARHLAGYRSGFTGQRCRPIF